MGLVSRDRADMRSASMDVGDIIRYVVVGACVRRYVYPTITNPDSLATCSRGAGRSSLIRSVWTSKY